MIRLDTTTRKLQAKLGGAATTSEVRCFVSYYDINNSEKKDNSEYRGSTKITLTSGTTDVDICAAPPQVGTIRNIDSIIIYNMDSVTSTVTVKFDDSGTDYILLAKALTSGQSLCYEDGTGWTTI